MLNFQSTYGLTEVLCHALLIDKSHLNKLLHLYPTAEDILNTNASFITKCSDLSIQQVKRIRALLRFMSSSHNTPKLLNSPERVVELLHSKGYYSVIRNSYCLYLNAKNQVNTYQQISIDKINCTINPYEVL